MKKVQRIALVSLLLFLLNAFLVHAALLSPVTSRLRYVFFNMSGTAAFSVWLKFAFFVIVFAILYNAGLRAFKSAEAPMKRALAVLTFVIALTSAIFIPYQLLLYIFKTYYVILVVLFALLPALIGFILCNKVLHGEDRWHRFMHAIIYILITIFIFGLIGQVEAKSSPDTKLFMQVLEPLMWGAIIALIAGFWNLLMALGGDTVASHVPQMLGGTRGAPPVPAHGATPAGPAHPGTPAPGAAPGAPTPPAGPAPPEPQGPRLPPSPISPQHLIPPWPDPDNPKHDPHPPKKVVFPIPRQLPPQPAPSPTKYVKPITIDLSQGFLPIKNQGATSACAAFAAGSIMEYMLNQQAQQVRGDHELSELYLWYLFRRQKYQNEGTYMHDIPRVDPRTCFEPFWTWQPCQGGIPVHFREQPNKQAHMDAEKKRVQRVRALQPHDPDSWVVELEHGNPILIGVEVDEGFCRGPLLYFERSGQLVGGHAMTIVGYTNQIPNPRDPSQSIAAYKVRNSWGSAWGQQGYIWMERSLLVQVLLSIPFVFEGFWGGQVKEPEVGPAPTKKDVEELLYLFSEQKNALQAAKKILTLEIKEDDEIWGLVQQLQNAQDKNTATRLLHKIFDGLTLEQRLGKKEYWLLVRFIKEQEKIYKTISHLETVLPTILLQEHQGLDDPLYVLAEQLTVLLQTLKQLVEESEYGKLRILIEKLTLLLHKDGPEGKMLRVVYQAKTAVKECKNEELHDLLSKLAAWLAASLKDINEKEMVPAVRALREMQYDLDRIEGTLTEILNLLEKANSLLQ